MPDYVTTAVLLILTLAMALRTGKRNGLSGGVSAWLFIWHLIGCAVYYRIAVVDGADAVFYFEESLEQQPDVWPGTPAIILFTRLFSHGLGFNLFNAFLVFNFLGTLGFVLLASSLFAVAPASGWRAKLPYLILMLPGLSFWTGMIGKDAVSFLGASLTVHASLQPLRRKFAMLSGLLLMMLARPHVALLMIVSLAIAGFLASGTSLRQRLAVLVVFGALSVAIAPFVLTYAGFSTDASLSDLSDYAESRQDANTDGTTSISLEGAPFAVVLLSYLFRPLPGEAPGALGLVLGLENLFLALLAALVAGNCFALLRHATFSVRYSAIYFVLGLLLLAPLTANLGLAARQKYMLLPGLFLLAAYSPRNAAKPVRRSPLQPESIAA